MQSKVPLISLCLVAGLTGLYLQLFGLNLPVKPGEAPAPEIENFLWPDETPLGNFELVNQDHGTFDRADLLDKWSFLFFGYTHCPDICPVTMHTLRQVSGQLRSSGKTDPDQFNFVFVSVDGERDTPDHLKRYIEFFDPGFIGITGNREQVDSLASQLSVPYHIEEHPAGAREYLVHHSGAIFLISPQGRLATLFQTPHDVDRITERFFAIETFTGQQS